jgi:CRP-like cAMP-binding protein
MWDVVTRRLGRPLAAPTQARLKEMLSHHKHLRPREELKRQGEVPQDVHFVLEGILARYKICGDKRAVLSYLLPGDFCGPHPDWHAPLDHGICSLTHVTVAEVPHHLLQECLHSEPDLAKALTTLYLSEVAIQRQWLANMGRSADKRLAHLICELRARLAQVGLADERSFQLGLTQQEMSEALGISAVHVNRTLQHLKDLGLLRILDRRVMIADLAKLEAFAEFDPAYLAFAGVALSTPRLAAAG